MKKPLCGAKHGVWVQGTGQGPLDSLTSWNGLRICLLRPGPVDDFASLSTPKKVCFGQEISCSTLALVADTKKKSFVRNTQITFSGFFVVKWQGNGLNRAF